MKRVSFQALACVTVLCTGLLLLNGCSDANQDTAEASSSSTAVTTTTTPTAAPAAKEIKPVAWHSEIEKSLPTLLGDESSRYAVYAFYPNSDSKPLIYQSRPMRSASMIKVFILGKAMADVEKGALSLDEPIILHDRDKVGGAGVIAGWADGTAIPISQLLRLMITESDNTATNLMIDRLGMDAINEYMQAKGYKDSKLARKMMDTAAAAAGRENMTSVNDLGTYFTRLWRQEGMSDALIAELTGATVNQFLVQAALKEAGLTAKDIDAVAYTAGPGLVGALLVGATVGRSLAFAWNVPAIPVHHMEGHLLAPMLEDNPPAFPFVALLVSGGHTQLVQINGYNSFKLMGQTRDDAAGEAFDKCAKVMGLGYPGGPVVNRLANEGNPNAFTFSKPHIPGYDYSFSGLKTSFLYTLRDHLKDDPDFIEKNKRDLCASLQATVIDILMSKLRKAAKDLHIKEVAVAGGVSANSGLREAFLDHAKRYGWKIHIPPFGYTTDNAAMIAITGYFKYLDKDFCSMDAAPYSRVVM